MDTGYPAMIPELQSPKKESKDREEGGILIRQGGSDEEQIPEPIPPCTPLKG